MMVLQQLERGPDVMSGELMDARRGFIEALADSDLSYDVKNEKLKAFDLGVAAVVNIVTEEVRGQNV